MVRIGVTSRNLLKTYDALLGLIPLRTFVALDVIMIRSFLHLD